MKKYGRYVLYDEGLSPGAERDCGTSGSGAHPPVLTGGLAVE